MRARILVLALTFAVACGDEEATGEHGTVTPASAGDGDASSASIGDGSGDDGEDTVATGTSDRDSSATNDDGGSVGTGGDETSMSTTGSAGACPVPFGTLDCASTCDLFVWECESCPMRPGDLCTYYPHQLDACLNGCAGLLDPGDITYEIFACRQSVGMVCDEYAVAQCLLDVDCA